MHSFVLVMVDVFATIASFFEQEIAEKAERKDGRNMGRKNIPAHHIPASLALQKLCSLRILLFHLSG